MSDTRAFALDNQVALLCAAQRQDWQRGELKPLEAYLQDNTKVTDDQSLLDLICHELELRYEREMEIDRADYARRFPALATQVGDLITVFQATTVEPEELDPTTLDPTVLGSYESTANELPLLRVPAQPDRAPTRIERQGPRPKLSSIPRRLGGYEILGEIARGGMGIVFRARQPGLDRVIALKMIRAGYLANQREVERFFTEARTAAALRHPNIVSVHEVKEVDGHAFFTMDYIEGPTLASLLDAGPLPAERAAKYLLSIVDAVAYAHEHDVLHRDLKPSNVLLDSADRPHITDFGLASALSQSASVGDSLTMAGTASYMSPEQIERGASELDHRSDLYSLGAILYELLTGHPPFRAASPYDTIRQALENDVVPLRLVNSAIPADLETICLKCLEKERHKRYLDARALQSDLERFLRDEPIQARPISVAERLYRRCRKYPFTALLLGLAAVLVLIQMIGAPIVIERERALRQQAEHQTAAADRQLKISTSLQLAATARNHWPDRPASALLRGAEALELAQAAGAHSAIPAEQFLRDALAQTSGTLLMPDSPVRHLQFSRNGRWLAAVLELDNQICLWNCQADEWSKPRRVAVAPHAPQTLVLDEQHLIVHAEDGQCWWTRLDEPQPSLQRLDSAPAHALLERPARNGFVLQGASGVIVVYRFDSDGQPEVEFEFDCSDMELSDVALSPRGSFLAAGDEAGQVRLWSLDKESTQKELGRVAAAGVRQLEFTLDEKSLLLLRTSDVDGLVTDSPALQWRLSDLTSAPRSLYKSPQPLRGYSLSPDGRWLGLGCADHIIRLADLHADEATSLQEIPWTKASSSPFAFSADSSALFACKSPAAPVGDRQIESLCRWPIGSEAPAELSVASSWWLNAPAGGNRVVAAHRDHSLAIYDWTAPEGIHREVLRAHTGPAIHLALQPQGRWLATAGADGTVRVHDLGAVWNDSFRTLQAGGAPITHIEVSPDSRWLVAASGAEQTLLCDLSAPVSAGVPLFSAHGKPEFLRTAKAIDLVVCGPTGNCERFQVHSLQKITQTPLVSGAAQGVEHVIGSRDGRWIYVVGLDGLVELHDAAGQTPPRVIRQFGKPVSQLDISPDGNYLVAILADGSVRLSSLGAAGPAQDVTLESASSQPFLTTVSFDQSSRQLIRINWKGAVTAASVDSLLANKPIAEVVVPESTASALSPDRTRLAVATSEARVVIYDLTSVPVREITRVESPVMLDRLALSSGNRWLLAAGAGRGALLWDLSLPRTEPIVLRPEANEAKRGYVGFTPDSRWAITTAGNRVHLWSLSGNLAQVARQLAGSETAVPPKQ